MPAAQTSFPARTAIPASSSQLILIAGTQSAPPVFIGQVFIGAAERRGRERRFPSMENRISQSDLTELVERMDEAADAYIRGDTPRYYALFDHASDYTLMAPYGGEAVHGGVPTAEGMAETSRFFASGEARLDVQQSYVSGDLAVLVAIERQHGEVGGLPDQDWSLRVTLVFRRVGERWEIVHRHADPLVRVIPFEACAELARG